MPCPAVRARALPGLVSLREKVNKPSFREQGGTSPSPAQATVSPGSGIIRATALNNALGLGFSAVLLPSGAGSLSVLGARPCPVGWSVASLGSTHLMPVASLPPSVTATNVSRHRQMSPRAGWPPGESHCVRAYCWPLPALSRKSREAREADLIARVLRWEPRSRER